MNITKIHYASRFIRDLKGLPPEKQKLIARKIKLFKQNPFTPSLKTHKLSGSLEGYWSFSKNYSDRVVFRFINESDVLFYKVGSYDIYKELVK